MKTPITWALMELLAIRLVRQLAIPLSNQKTVAKWLVITKQKTLGKSLVMAAVFSLGAMTAEAADVSLSGFGTLGYAKSNQPYAYQRFIKQSGSFMRDTVFGAQADVQFNPEWGATLQVKAAPSLDSDNRWDPTISWAFLSYRPTNNLLLRLGKLRIPFYMSSENYDVGATYAFARQPYDMYSTLPTTDFNGVSFSKSWDVRNNEVSLDGYWGQTNYTARWLPFQNGIGWSSFKLDAEGLRLMLHQEDNTFYIGIHNFDASGRYPSYILAPFVQGSAIPGLVGTYYLPEGTPPTGTPLGSSARDNILMTNMGFDYGLGQGFRVMGEYLRRPQRGTSSGPDTKAFYVSLSKQAGPWTPYITYSQMKSQNLGVYQALKNANVQPALPLPILNAAAGTINFGQQWFASTIPIYDQYSVMLGAAYSLNPSSKIKAEWMRTHVGDGSSMVDAPLGGFSNQNINVFSLSYNFVY